MPPVDAANYTPTQGQYLAFIHAYLCVMGRPPAEADLQRFFRVTPPSVHHHFYVGATLTTYPPPGSHGGKGNFIAWDPVKGKVVWSKPERFPVWSGALTTAGDIVFYGTLEGYLKAISTKDGKELWKFKTSSGIIGNVFTYEYDGKQYVGVYSGIGGWAGIGLAAGLSEPGEGLGVVGGYKDLAKYTTLGGSLFVLALPEG